MELALGERKEGREGKGEGREGREGRGGREERQNTQKYVEKKFLVRRVCGIIKEGIQCSYN